MTKRGYALVSGGTDTHLMLVDLKPAGVDGARVERVLELAHIAANKNTVPGDRSALVPGGLRIGTPAMTSRGLTEADWDRVADFIDRGVKLAVDIKKNVSGTKVKDFKAALGEDGGAWREPITALREDVHSFARHFPTVGFEEADITSDPGL